MKKLIVKILALTLLLAFSCALSAQTPDAIEKQKAAITALLNKGDCDGAQAKYDRLKITRNYDADIEKRIADCKNNKSAKSEPTPKPAQKPTPKPAPKPKPQAKPAQKNKPVSKTTTKQRPQTKDTKPPAITNSKPRAVDRSYGQWVDLGLPSGTLWKNANETNPNDNHDFYTYDEAVKKYGDQLPTEAQLRELKDKCKWTWKSSKKGYIVVGPNGNSIFLPAAGYRYCLGNVYFVGSCGNYWPSTPDGSEIAWYLYFDSGEVYMNYSSRCNGQSVRLVQD